MGKADDEPGLDRETPRHRVEIQHPFALSAVPVTNEIYAAFDDGKPPHAWNDVPRGQLRTHPRVGVTWYEAVSFCRWLATQPRDEPADAPTLPDQPAVDS